jgi:hypothetical protein
MDFKTFFFSAVGLLSIFTALVCFAYWWLSGGPYLL